MGLKEAVSFWEDKTDRRYPSPRSTHLPGVPISQEHPYPSPNIYPNITHLPQELSLSQDLSQYYPSPKITHLSPVTNQNAELRQALHPTGLTLQRDQVTMKAVQDKVSELEVARTQLYNQLTGSISACRVVEESLRCEKAAHADTKRTLSNQMETCKQLSYFSYLSNLSR